MRQLAAGNWKMNGVTASLSEIEALKQHLKAEPANCDVMICPPATLVMASAEAAAGSPIQVGGQDCHAKTSGAHTGDVSAQMLADAGATAVIVGHSERRADHGETNEQVRAKAEAAHAAGLMAIICLGETLAQREAGETLAIVHESGNEHEAWFFPAMAETVLAEQPAEVRDQGVDGFVERLQSENRVILELEPVQWISFDGRRVKAHAVGTWAPGQHWIEPEES